MMVGVLAASPPTSSFRPFAQGFPALFWGTHGSVLAAPQLFTTHVQTGQSSWDHLSINGYQPLKTPVTIIILTPIGNAYNP